MCLHGVNWDHGGRWEEGAEEPNTSRWLLACPGTLSGMKDSPRAWNLPQIASSFLGRKDLSPNEVSRSCSALGCWDFKYQRNKKPWVTCFFPLYPVTPPAIPFPWNSGFFSVEMQEENDKKREEESDGKWERNVRRMGWETRRKWENGMLAGQELLYLWNQMLWARDLFPLCQTQNCLV